MMEPNYSVKKLSKLAGVSVRTLHLYDQLGLLKPSIRTSARYRLYGDKELLKLQQILFYKELDFSLKEIKSILDDPDFDLVQALEGHRSALKSRAERIGTLLNTIDKTINNLKSKTMLNTNDLYAGLPKEKAEAYRNKAAAEWGEDKVNQSETALKKLSKSEFEALKKDFDELVNELYQKVNDAPENAGVQELIGKHYDFIRKFWGTEGTQDKQAAAYAGLGELYVAEPGYTKIDGKPNITFANFLAKAMKYFAENALQ